MVKRSLVSVSELSREEVEEILALSEKAKRGKIRKIRGDAVLMFLEPSTRTRLSFEKACGELGLSTYVITKDESSIVKGESLTDTLKTFEALGFDVVILRVPTVLFPYEDVVRSFSLSLINAGDGTHQHPTQGLVDLFTLLEKFGSLKDLKVLYVGDILHSRVFRSGAPLLRMFGARVSVCGPATLLPKDTGALNVEGVFDDVDEGIEWADVVVWLRLQKERQGRNLVPSDSWYLKRFGLTKDRYKRLRGYFMHPGPVSRGVDMEGDLLYSDKSLIYEQAKNGLFVRMGVLSWCMGWGSG